MIQYGRNEGAHSVESEAACEKAEEIRSGSMEEITFEDDRCRHAQRIHADRATGRDFCYYAADSALAARSAESEEPSQNGYLSGEPQAVGNGAGAIC